MDDHKSEFSIVKMSQTLGVSRSGYYRWRGRGPSRRSLDNERLTKNIKQIWADSAKTYGSPRIHRQLLADGETLSRPRVARLMNKAGLASQIRPQWITTTDSSHTLPVAPNVLDRDFTAQRPGQVWVSDITYLPSEDGWLYLTTVMDLADRQILGWALSKGMSAEQTSLAAFNQAVSKRIPGEKMIFHSDQGSQYACEDFRKKLDTYGIRQSMSRKGNCWDNAPAESFFKTLKAELPLDTSGCSYRQIREALFAYIDMWYNRKRLHSSLDYRTPAQMEQLLTNQNQQAA